MVSGAAATTSCLKLESDEWECIASRSINDTMVGSKWVITASSDAAASKRPLPPPPLLLGKGAFATCWQFTCKTASSVVPFTAAAATVQVGSRLAVKVPNPKGQKYLKRESRIHACLGLHPNIVRWEGILRSTTGLNYGILMELVPSPRTLADVLTTKRKRRLPIHIAGSVAHQLALAIEHMHRHRVLHGDIKPANILVGRGRRGLRNVKICDFGFSVRLKSDANKQQKRVRGSPNFLAPEIAALCLPPPKLKPPNYYCEDSSGYGLGVDVWALGVVVFVMVAGRAPFEAANGSLMTTLRNIAHGNKSSHIPPPLPFPASLKATSPALYRMRRAIRHMLDRDLDRRWSAREVVDHARFII